ncbi:MAG: ATP-binding protein [Pseudomonadota bacterium]
MLIRIREFGNGPRGRWLREQLAGVVVALLIVAALTAALAAAILWLPVEHVSIVYLIPVIVAALRWGAIPAMFAAIAGIAATAFFFYAPHYDFRVRSPAQIVDIVLFIAVATITGRMAVAVREAKIRAQAESLRDALIGSVSHELRTPLASIMGSASILAQAPAIDRDAHLSSLVRLMREEAERLNGDIQNLLDATRISADGIRPHWGWVDPEDIVNGALVRKRRLLGDRQIALAIADDLPLAYVDPSMIESALAQLIENAAKYAAPRTPIAIGAAQDNGTIRIEVANEGEALASGEIERIFERFYRSPRYAGVIPGSGLGLWIARALVQACGGRVEAVSSSHGTTFRIDLPVRTQPSSDEYADE